MTVVAPQCEYCKNLFKKAGYSCRAFPDGIPKEIIDSTADHRKPFPGDNDIKFELIPRKKKGYKEFLKTVGWK
jgi:hypothetical protein